MDTHGKTPAQSNVEYDNKLKAKPKNVLTLNHETHVGTVCVLLTSLLASKYTNAVVFNSRTVLPHILKTFHEKGYKFVTVADCLGNKVKPYQSTNKIPAYNVRLISIGSLRNAHVSLA